MCKHLFILTAALLAATGIGANLNPAQACEPYCELKKVVAYEYVTTYETRRVAYPNDFTLYDSYGRPYIVTRTSYRDVRVPVKKTIPVVKWVKVGAAS